MGNIFYKDERALIYELPTECCDEMFEYLSLADLHSFGQTCKKFNELAGEYFKRNFSAKYLRMNFYDTPRFPGFVKYTTKVDCLGVDKLPVSKLKYIDEFDSIKYLSCHVSNLSVQGIIQILPKIETVFLFDKSKNFKNLNESFSELCPNLVKLHVRTNGIFKKNQRWLHQVYSNLTHFKCNPLPRIDDLKSFFEKNPTVRNFSANLRDIWQYRDWLLSSTIKLDLLEALNVTSSEFLKRIEFLNQLFERGFYKRLDLEMNRIEQNCCNALSSIRSLERLHLNFTLYDLCLPQLTQLKRLTLTNSCVSQYDCEHFANGCVNIEEIYFDKASIRHILPFIRRSKNLEKIMLGVIYAGLPLSMLNEEREKLPEARKVTIYVIDDIYLKTKKATKNGNITLSLIRMRRFDSFDRFEFS